MTEARLVTAVDITCARLGAKVEGGSIADSITRMLDYQREVRRAVEELKRGEWLVEA